MKRTALITGATGLVGSVVADALLKDGWRVLYCSRLRPAVNSAQTVWLPYDITAESLPSDFGLGAEVLIHSALATGPGRVPLEANLFGTRLLLAATRRNGVGRRIFISSLVAGTDAASRYAEQKREIEKLFDGENDAVIRPGLVIGNGGLFGAICDALQHGMLFPLIDRGSQPIQTVYDGDLARIATRVANEHISGLFSVAESEAVSYRRFLETVASELGVPIRFISMPFWLADIGLRLTARVPLNLPVSREQLLSLRAMRCQGVTADPRILPEPLHRYEESVRLALSRRNLVREAE